MKTMLKYDFMYWMRTAKLLVYGVLAIFLAMLSVLSARFMNVLLRWAFESEGIPIDTIGEPTVFDSYEQFFSNQSQLFMLVAIFIGLSFYTHARNRGHYPMLFSKPIRRQNFLLSKAILMNGFTVLALWLSALVFSFYTAILFEGFEPLRFVLAMIPYTIFFIFMMQVALFFSVLFKSYILAAVSSIAVLVFLPVFSLIDRGIFKVLPSQLMNGPLIYLQDETHTQIWGASLVTLALGLVLLGISLVLFNKRPLT